MRKTVFTMTGAAAKTTEETLYQVRRVQDMVILLATHAKKDDYSVQTNRVEFHKQGTNSDCAKPRGNT